MRTRQWCKGIRKALWGCVIDLLYSNLWTQTTQGKSTKWSETNHLFWNKQNGLDVKAPLNSFSSVSVIIRLFEKLWNLNANFTHLCANATWHFISKILALLQIKQFYTWTRRHFSTIMPLYFLAKSLFWFNIKLKSSDCVDKNYQKIMIFNMTRKYLYIINIWLEASQP